MMAGYKKVNKPGYREKRYFQFNTNYTYPPDSLKGYICKTWAEKKFK